ncbi:MAG: CPA2 family monovalent cation:H+ antiporter-2 [Glaciecola sp.]|jgi:CPA2 family monovalent cation:H+ antiporter-2
MSLLLLQAKTVDHTFISIISLMAIAVFLVWFFKRISLPPILAYLVAGVVTGPELLKLFTNPDDMHLAAEVGIVFLLFSLGLEFSVARMVAMRRLVFGVGAAQMCLTTAILAAIGLLFGQSMTASLIIGASIALSSTAIVIKTIDGQGKLNTQRSQLAVSILLFQDIAVVPLLIIIPLLSATSEISIGNAILISLIKGIVVVALLLSIGKWLLPRIFNEIAKTKTDELFVLSTILIALLAAGTTFAFGLSMALGAFLAGMMLSESQYRHQLESDIRPFRDILMGIFFVTVGMKLELSVLLSELHIIVLGIVILVVVKVVVVRISAWISREKAEDGWAAGFKLAQMGEFSFVIIALALENQLISKEQSSILVCMGLFSMAITPWLIDKSGPFSLALVGNKSGAVNLESIAPKSTLMQNHVIILGFGRVGQSVARMLKLEAVPFQAIDIDPIRVQESRNAGEPVLYGDGSQKDILTTANIAQATSVIITFDQHSKAMQVINTIKAINPATVVLVRTRKDHHLQELFDAGASQVVPEMQEGSLMLISQVLHYSGIPMSRILKRIRNERKQGYEHMHGFFPGETTEINFETSDKLEFLHAIVMTNNAFAVGKSIEELGITNKRVKLISIRRNGKEQEHPSPDYLIESQDVVVISGKPRRVERIEKYLLNGG